MKRIILAAAPVLALALTAPVHATGAEQASDASYTLTVRYPATDETKEVTLECAPVGGTHPRADAACETIAEGGSIEGVSGQRRTCPFIHAPVVATASGAEDYQQEFSNDCVLKGEKGAVFDF